MSLYVASLNSGSNGNSYFVSNGKGNILVDCGISCREIEKRLKRLGHSVNQLSAVFISHEHGDHIHGITTLVKKYGVPVYISPLTLQCSGLNLPESLIFTLSAYNTITIQGLKVTAFPKLHDAADPHSFIVSNNNVTIGVFTDIGSPCEHVIRQFNQCHAAFLESNYDEVMLLNGRYPYALKERVRSHLGHLSNAQALELFKRHRSPYLSHLFLSHLSRNNNTPSLAKSLFDEVAGRTEIIVASRNKESKLYHIRNNMSVRRRGPKAASINKDQLSLFV